MNKCPKCGAGEDASDSAYSCGTRKGTNGTVKVSGRCLRRQLAAVTAERDMARQSWAGAISLLEERTTERDRMREELDGLKAGEPCACRWDHGNEKARQQCEIHEAWEAAIHDWAARAKSAESENAALRAEVAEATRQRDELRRMLDAVLALEEPVESALRAENEALKALSTDAIGSIDALRARAEAAEWRPIETAPKDGRAVLLHNNNAPGNPSGRMESCEGYNTVVGEWWASDQSDDDADGLGDWTCYMDAIEDPRCPFEPTHWMPLPAAPDQKGES